MRYNNGPRTLPCGTVNGDCCSYLVVIYSFSNVVHDLDECGHGAASGSVGMMIRSNLSRGFQITEELGLYYSLSQF